MIVLDTNVVSETMKPQPDAAVLAWLDRQVVETLYLTSITLAELWFGIAAIPAGKRRDRLAAVLDGVVGQFDGRVLPCDVEAARHHAKLALTARKAGRGFPVPDGYIAAIAASRGFIVASRDASAFVAGGLPVIDPWTQL